MGTVQGNGFEMTQLEVEMVARLIGFAGDEQFSRGARIGWFLVVSQGNDGCLEERRRRGGGNGGCGCEFGDVNG